MNKNILLYAVLAVMPSGFPVAVAAGVSRRQARLKLNQERQKYIENCKKQGSEPFWKFKLSPNPLPITHGIFATMELV